MNDKQQCAKCGAIFKTPEKLLEHEKIHEKAEGKADERKKEPEPMMEGATG